MQGFFKKRNKKQKGFIQTRFLRAKNASGFTLALSVLVAALMLVIGLSVSLISIKQFNLSIIARDTELAFYAADAAAECALYWDTTTLTGAGQSIFGGYDQFGSQGGAGNFTLPVIPMTTGYECNSELITNPATGWDSGSGWVWSQDSCGTDCHDVVFDMTFSNNSCATVTVTKDSNQAVGEQTSITSRGFNLCNTSSTRRVERAIEVEY